MKTKRAGLRTVLRKIEQPADRSSLFHWMVEHHDQLLARANEARLVWADLCATFTELGLTNRDGQPASQKIARLTWYRARKVVADKQVRAARKAATGLAPRSLMPSASPRARTPIEHMRSSRSEAPAINTPSPIPLPKAGSDTSTRAGGLISDEQVAAKKARMMRTLAERSGR